MNPRKLWRPKMPMLKEPCASCPFRDGNDTEFLKIVRKLAASRGRPAPQTPHEARGNIKAEAESRGDFACHHTVYDENMDVKPFETHKQCPGAAEYFVKAGERLVKKRR